MNMRMGWVRVLGPLLMAGAAGFPLTGASQGAASVPESITRAGEHRVTLQHGGLSREYLVHVPARYRPGEPMPLVLSFHGGGGNMEIQANDRTFAAIAAVAGTDGSPACAPSRPVSVLHIHALDDDRVLFNGGSGRASATHANFVSVPETVAKWARLNGREAAPRRLLEVPGAYCETRALCRGGSEVRLCVTETGGHAWPGGRKVLGGQQGSTAIVANDVIWDFFSRR